jgi:hypothetical protein
MLLLLAAWPSKTWRDMSRLVHEHHDGEIMTAVILAPHAEFSSIHLAKESSSLRLESLRLLMISPI